MLTVSHISPNCSATPAKLFPDLLFMCFKWLYNKYKSIIGIVHCWREHGWNADGKAIQWQWFTIHSVGDNNIRIDRVCCHISLSTKNAKEGFKHLTSVLEWKLAHISFNYRNILTQCVKIFHVQAFFVCTQTLMTKLHNTQKCNHVCDTSYGMIRELVHNACYLFGACWRW